MKKTLLIFLLTPCFLVAQTISEKYVKQHIYTLSNDSCKAEKQVRKELKKQQNTLKVNSKNWFKEL